jgi:hypothetical protein
MEASSRSPRLDSWDSMEDSVFTVAIESELKKDSPDGCLLCLLEELDAEEWG